MADIVIPVALSLILGPGLGQLYNKEVKKGVVLIVLSFAILIWAIVWFRGVLQPLLPTDLLLMEPEAMKTVVSRLVEEVLQNNSRAFYGFQILLGILWIYSVIDAYYGAVRRSKTPKPV